MVLPHENHVPTLPGNTNTGERYINYRSTWGGKAGGSPQYRVFPAGYNPGRVGIPKDFPATSQGFGDAITYRDAVLSNSDIFALDPSAPRFAGPRLVGFNGFIKGGVITAEGQDSKDARRIAVELAPHFTYVMRLIDRAGGPDRIKVGFTSNLAKRGKAHGILGFDVELIEQVKYTGKTAAKQAEVTLIRRFVNDQAYFQVAPETFVRKSS